MTISPLYASSADIRPSRYVPLSWIALAPRDPGAVDWLYDLGYRDALFWMAGEGIVHPCKHDHCHPAGSPGQEGDEQRDPGEGVSADNNNEKHLEGVARLVKESLTVENADNGWEPAGDLPSPSVVSSGAEKGVSPTNARSGDNPGIVPKDGPDRGTLGGERQAGAAENSGEKGTGMGTAIGAGAGGSTNEEKGLPGGKGLNKTGHYLRTSFVLSGCHMRPRRERHPQLDEPAFVPSLEQFVGHGSYDRVTDFVFLIFFNVVWRPAAALLIYADLTARLILVVALGSAKEIRPLLQRLVTTVIVVGFVMERRATVRESLGALATLACVVAVRARREGAPSAGEWRRARKIVRALLEYRILLRCLPWGHRKDNVKLEALDNSLLYRAVKVFM